MSKDRFTNIIDSEVGYARGQILKDSLAEKMRISQAIKIIRNRAEEHGSEAFYVFTGNFRYNQLKSSDLGTLSEEWVGPGLFQKELKEQIGKHLDAGSDFEVAVFNRTAAALVASILALGAPGKRVISCSPKRKPHPSIRRGIALLGAKAVELENACEIAELDCQPGDICVITSVTSELHCMEGDGFEQAIAEAKKKNMPVIVDEAYGARIRPLVFGQKSAIALGADVAITNNDKAGLHGPRAGVMAGDPVFVNRIASKAAELGLAARVPVALGVLRSLEHYSPGDLHKEIETGEMLTLALKKEMGDKWVRQSLLGPEVSEEDFLEFLLTKAGVKKSDLVPAEAAAAAGLLLLKDFGIVTVNALGMPGARVSLRLKSDGETVKRFGGPQKVACSVMETANNVGSLLNNLEAARELITGS